MLPITTYLLGNPLVAIGLGILVLLCIYNVLRKQVRVAMGLWLLVFVVLFYIYRQSVVTTPNPSKGATEILQRSERE